VRNRYDASDTSDLPMFRAKSHGFTAELKDEPRLSDQLRRVRDLMLDGTARSLAEISAAVSAPEASVSARLRDLRRPECGGYLVERENLGGGRFTYKVGRR
jgi:hypothetical protein